MAAFGTMEPNEANRLSHRRRGRVSRMLAELSPAVGKANLFPAELLRNEEFSLGVRRGGF